MKTAIVIGSYRLVDFVRLNILRCRRIWGEDVNILISDDKSAESDTIMNLAFDMNCDYFCPRARRSHFSGDMQSILNGLVYAREVNADICLKLSQRFIVVLPEFRIALEKAMADPDVKVCLPGQIHPSQIARPAARFYRKFGILTDAVALRAYAIEPAELLKVYRERCQEADARKRPVSDSFSETTWGYLLDKYFPGIKHKILPEWTNHRVGQPKLYLRKSQSPSSDYHQVAAMEGITGDFDLREWLQIEGREGYKAKADVV